MKHPLPTQIFTRLDAAKRSAFLFFYFALMAAVPHAVGQYVDGADYVCVGATQDYFYRTGGAPCDVTPPSPWSPPWEVSGNGTIVQYLMRDNNPHGGVRVKWNSAGAGTVTAKLPICTNKTKTTQVGPQAVGSISGPQSFQCDRTTQATYTIAANPSATFQWNVTIGLGIRYSSQSANTVVFSVDPISSFPSGTITCTVTDCGTTTTKTLPVYRTQPPGSITGPNSICTYRSTQYTTGYGANHVWTASPSSFVVSSSGPSATVQATSAASGYLKVTYNRLCDNALVTHTTGLYATSCGATMAIAPNPVADVAEISYPDEGKEYEVNVYDSFRRVVAAGKVRRGKLRLDVRSLPKGLYYVHFTDGNAVLVTGKLIKE